VIQKFYSIMTDHVLKDNIAVVVVESDHVKQLRKQSYTTRLTNIAEVAEVVQSTKEKN
jgi:galactokinase